MFYSVLLIQCCSSYLMEVCLQLELKDEYLGGNGRKHTHTYTQSLSPLCLCLEYYTSFDSLFPDTHTHTHTHVHCISALFKDHRFRAAAIKHKRVNLGCCLKVFERRRCLEAGLSSALAAASSQLISDLCQLAFFTLGDSWKKEAPRRLLSLAVEVKSCAFQFG